MNVYFVDINNSGGDQNFYIEHARAIMEVNPDQIICLCISEYRADKIFKEFLDELENWLEIQDKTVTILACGLDRQLRDRVFVKKCFSYYFNNRMVVTDAYNLDYSERHLSEKLFTLYCHRGTEARQKIVDLVVRDNLLNDGIITYHHQYEIYPGWQYHDGTILKDEEDFELCKTQAMIPNSFPASFFNGYIDIVCESRIRPNEFYMSEKTAKSIAGMKPFMALSSQYYHRFLAEEYGILPYDEVFDYTFDSLPDFADRAEGIVENIKKVKNMDRKTINEMLLPKIVANRDRFLSCIHNSKMMVPSALEFLFNGQDYTISGNNYFIENYAYGWGKTYSWTV